MSDSPNEAVLEYAQFAGLLRILDLQPPTVQEYLAMPYREIKRHLDYAIEVAEEKFGTQKAAQLHDTLLNEGAGLHL